MAVSLTTTLCMLADTPATKGQIDYGTVFGIATILLGIVSLWLSFKNKAAQDAAHTAQAAAHTAQAALNTSIVIRGQIETRNAALEEQIRTMRQWAEARSQLEYAYQDIVLFGPRNAGKTSVAKLWTTPWTNIDGMPHTREWTLYETSVFSIDKEIRHDPTFDVDRIHERILRVRIHDYPGDDEYRLQAVSKLPGLLSKAVLLLFFEVQVDDKGCIPTSKNNSYYSKAFLESIESERRVTSSLSKVIVVFNKVELLPPNWSLETTRKTLREINADADRRLNSLFSGMLEYHFVSAWTNQGLISLLGAAASAGLPAEAKKRFEQHLEKLYYKGTQGIDAEVPRRERWSQ